MSEEWKRFNPGREYIGLRARFRKVVHGEVEPEEAVGVIVADWCPYPWQFDVLLKCDDGRLLPFMNGSAPFYDDKDGERHWLGEPFIVEYFYAPIDNASPCDKPAAHCGKPKLKPLENGRIPRIPEEVLARLSEYEKKMLTTSLFEDADASVEHVKKNMPRILTEHLRRENELAERMKGDWNFKERD